MESLNNGGTGQLRSVDQLLREEEPSSWSASIADWDVQVGEDHLGNPAIWVWVILERSQTFEQRDAIHNRVMDIIADSGEERWVYIRFRTKAEQKQLQIGQLLREQEKSSWPVPIADRDVEVEEDHLDNPAISVWVTLENNQALAQ